MRIAYALVLVAALVASAYAECNGKTSPNSYVGDVSIEDYVVELSSSAPAGFIAIPEITLGAAYHTFEMDALLTSENGCLFSFGTPGPNYVEASVEARRLYVRIGAAAPLAASIPVFDVNTWQHVAIAFNNSRRSVEVYLDGLRVIPDPSAQGVTEFVHELPLGFRSGFIGKCPGKPTLAPVSAVDNFFVTTSYRTAADVLDTLKQFFPVLPENDLVAYFGFNEPTGNAKSLNGRATNNWLEAVLGGSATRKLRNQVNTNGAMVTDTVCSFSGSVILDGGDSTVVNIPYYKTAGGGFTNTIDCSASADAPSFIINQRWDDNGAVIGVSIFSHQEHRWRITPGPYLRVERADWGGWLLLAESIGVIEEDRSTYIIGSNEFQLQIAGQGWVRVTLASPTSLAYQYSLASKSCATATTRDMCSFKVTDSDKYFFSNIAMNEPMGLVDPTSGVGQLPATLACPTPSYDGYRPDLYCASSRAYGDMRCCSMNRDLSWCPVYYEKCWRSGYVNMDCCSQFKYRTGSVRSERLPYCPITNADCWEGQFVTQCCKSDALRIRNGNVLPQCSVSEADCWGWKMYGTARTITDSRCCAYDWSAMRGYRYYNNAVRFPECPIEPRDCWTAPVANIQDPQCCSNTQTRYQGQVRLSFCTPTQAECWRWYTTPNYYRQEDPKCCTQDKMFWKNAAGEKIALPWCALTNADCWSGLIDARCCASDDLKYFKKTDGSLDYTKRLAQCIPTTDDCWGWQTNPAKFPVKVEDQRCCQADNTRYNPNTLQRLDYCYPNFKDCWGFYVMGSLRDEDQRCCQSFVSLNEERLPYCAPSTPIPPPPPVAPPPPPTLKVDVCVNVSSQDPQKFASIQNTCQNLYGAVDTVAYKTCVATMCKDGDPGTPPIPDCRVERLLKAANPAYKVPTICESGCPNGCYGRGSCTAGKCQCNADYTGADCSIPVNFNKCDVSLRSPSATAGVNVQCQPFPVTYYNKGVTPMLTRDFTNVTVQYYDMAKRMRDTVTVYMIKTIDDFVTRAEQFHLVITNNDGAGFTGGSYTMDIDFVAGSDLSNMKWARIGEASVVLPGTGANAGAPLKATVSSTWTMAGRTGVVLFNVSRGSAPDFTVTVRAGSNIPQYVMGCQSPSGAFEVMKFTPTEYSANGIHVKCSKINAQCNAADCKSCAALDNCGWCVETASCQPGSTIGPFIGQCFNWRYTFDSNINRRLTIVPGYPTNPRQTDVYLRQAVGGNELPIEVAVTAVEQSAVPWDFVMLNEYTTATKSAFVPSGIVNILQSLRELPNSGVAIANLRTDATGFNFIKMITNPRDYTGIPDALASADTAMMTPATGDLDVLNALFRTCDPSANTFNLRPAARTVILVSTARMYKPASAEFMKTLRQRLLDRNAAIVFAVPGALTSAYEALVAQLTIGRVINMNADFSNLARVVPVAINRASSSIGLSVGLNADNTVSGHINDTYYKSRLSTYTIDNVRPPMRAKFWVPVTKTASVSRTTTLYFPTYGRSIIETVATDLPTSSDMIVEARAGVATLIELKGMSYRNLYKVAFNVTRLPDPAKGNLFIAVMDNTGAWVKSNTLPKSGELITVPTTVPFGRLIYVSKDTTSTGVNFANFGFVVIDGCAESREYNVQLNVVAGNVAPVAEMPSPRGLEGTPLLIELGGSDADGDAFVFTLTRNLYDATEGVDRNLYPVGKFCAYDVSWETNEFKSADCTALQAPVQLNSPQIIYVPPTYGNSFADPLRRPELLLIPCFSYKVTELSTKDASPLKSSNELDVQIILDHVNQAPFAWYDPMDTVREAVFKFDFKNATDNAQMDCVPRVGGWQCTWQEDFGELYYWNAGYRYIALGGFDIEGSELTAEITYVSPSCPSGMVLTPHYDDSTNIKAGTIIPKLPSGYLTPVLKFRPAKETHSDGVTPYCTFRYRVQDKEGATSAREASVDIHITDVDKPPRMSQQVMDVVSYELRPKNFAINAEDPENKPFDGFLVGCTSKKGKLQICLNYPTCSNLQTISCDNLGSGIQLQETVFKNPSATNPKWIGVFTSDKLASISEGHMYETFYFEFRDQSAFVPEKFRVNMNVIKINTPPKIFVANNEGVEQHEASYSTQLPMNTAWSAKFRVEDEDIGFGAMDINVTLDDSYAATASFDLAALSRAFDGLTKGLAVQTPTRIEFRGSLAAVNKLLSALTVLIPDAKYFPDSGFATAIVKVSVDDNGFTGQCPDATSFSVRTCPLTDATEFTITWAKPQDNNNVTVAASASAAAFAGIAAIAAAILFRQVNRRAEEEYAPWNVDDGDDGVVSNPLYENTGMSGTNPLFEGENGGL